MAKKSALTDKSTVLCTIQRDYWDENEVRHRAGTVVEVPFEFALDGIASGALAKASDDEVQGYEENQSANEAE